MHHYRLDLNIHLFFYIFSAAQHQIGTTGKKLVKIHQLEQLSANVPICWFNVGGGGCSVVRDT